MLSHRLQDGSDKHIAFASRSLSDCEKKYAQLEKEALTLIFGIAKFHKYLYGREFLLQTDHMPLSKRKTALSRQWLVQYSKDGHSH